jgi:hypothetical protein
LDTSGGSGVRSVQFPGEVQRIADKTGPRQLS